MDVSYFTLCRIQRQPMTDEEFLVALTRQYESLGQVVYMKRLCNLVLVRPREPSLPVVVRSLTLGVQDEHFMWVNRAELDKVLEAFPPGRITSMFVERPAHRLRV